MLNEFFENAPCGYFSFFDDGKIFVFNETFCKLLGYDKEALKDRNVESIFTLSTRIFYQTHFFPLVKMQGHAEEIFLSLLTNKGQHLPVLLNAKREEHGGKLFTSCAFITVPNRKKFEDELVAAKNVAEKALQENSELLKAKADLQQHTERLDAQIQLVNKQNSELKQLNHVVTHSLKEPLRKILIYSERINDKAQPNILKLARATKQMRVVVTGLQQYVWLDNTPSHFTHIDLNDLAEKAAAQLRQELNADLLNLHMVKLPSLEADAEQIQLLLYHILSNAIKFKKDEKAEVTITATALKQNIFRSVEHKYKYEDFIKLEITDKGIGFDPAFKEYIFDLFRKLHDTEGHGLGLALSKKVATNHFGLIEADSRINEYTRITVLLPLFQTTR